jgi:plasmid stability protein
MASLTVRNLPDEAKLRFRQIAAAHGRSMEEHNFRHQNAVPAPVSRAPNWIDELIRLGQGLDLEIPPRKPEKLREIDLG